MTVRCILCDVPPLVCPADEDWWGWLQKPEARAFIEAHRQLHGTERVVGAQIVTIVKE